MADGITITVDATRALAKFSPSGIPVEVRNNLRQAIPGLMRDLTAQVDSNLGALKSRKNLQIKGGPQGVMIESASQLIGRAEMGWIGDPRAAMVPQVLESGAKPHIIAAVNAKALSFFWAQMGGQVFFKQVHHPGFPGIHYMENAFKSMQTEIVDKVGAAVQTGLDAE
jgi:hypothetical protein